MILSDTTIHEHLQYPNLTETITVDPDPDEEQIQPASLDVRIGAEILHPETGENWISDTIRLEPGQRYLAETAEEVSLPNDIAAQVAGRSTIGRRGIIVHKTAGWIDPGFSGTITLELMNLGSTPQSIDAGSRVAQLVFFELDQPSAGYDGKYQNQSGPTQSR